MKTKCKHIKVMISDSILTCLFTATCLKCGKVAGGYKTIAAAKKGLRK